MALPLDATARQWSLRAASVGIGDTGGCIQDTLQTREFGQFRVYDKTWGQGAPSGTDVIASARNRRIKGAGKRGIDDLYDTMEIEYSRPCEAFVAFNLTTEVCVARIDRDSARVSFLDTASRAELAHVPADARLVRLEDDDQAPCTCPPVGNSFFINWTRSYALYSGQHKVFDIVNERTQRVIINET